MEIDDHGDFATAPSGYAKAFAPGQFQTFPNRQYFDFPTLANAKSPKKKKRAEIESSDDDDEEQYVRSHKMLKISDSKAMELQELLEHWSITNESHSKPKPNWENIRNELRSLFSVVNIVEINDMVEKEKQLHPEYFRDEKLLQQFYKDLFSHWSVSSDSNKRLGHIFIGTAIHVWALVLRERCNFFDVWVAFLVEKKVQYISRDTWNLFYEFCSEFNSKGFATYSFDACWPTLNDEFVNFYRNHNIHTPHS